MRAMTAARNLFLFDGPVPPRMRYARKAVEERPRHRGGNVAPSGLRPANRYARRTEPRDLAPDQRLGSRMPLPYTHPAVS